MFWMSIVLVVVCSAPVHTNTACRRRTDYLDNNGWCQPCPSRCKSCVSFTNCTECQNNYWGLTCHMECRQLCPLPCQKEYGHCTYGCRDGTFINPDNKSCTNCTPNCKVCSSASECIRCKPRFYGPECRSCPKSCVGNRCNMTTGECFVCKYGYFREDGNCQKCPDGCPSCTDGGNCTTCGVGFYGPYNGKCFLGCRNTDPTSQFLANDEDKCGVPKGLVSHNTRACEHVSGDLSYTCSENRYCLTNKTCSSDDSCPLNQDDDTRAGVCLKVMSEVCFAKCPPSTTTHEENVNNYLCSQTCTVENVGGGRYGPVCFPYSTRDSSNFITVGYPLSTIDVLCFPGVDEISESPVWRKTAIIFILVSGLLVLILIKMGCMYRITSRGSAFDDEVNAAVSLHPQPFEESRNQHAFPHLIIRRDSMYDHAAPIDDASQSGVGMDVVDGTADSFYDHVLMTDDARQWMLGVDSVEGTAGSLQELSQTFPPEDRDSPDKDSFLADDREKFGSQAIYTECE